MQEVLRTYFGEIVGMLGGISGRVVFDDLTILARQHTTGFVGIARDDVCQHIGIHRRGNTYFKRRFIYHNSLASKSSSSSPSSRVQRSSLRYFQPPSAKMTTIFPCSILAPTRKAACNAAPQDGPAKIPS